MPGQAQQTAAPTIDQEGLATLKRIRDKQGIALAPIGPGSRVLYIFADPNCPHCRSLELALAQMPSNVVPVIMPVAFFSGSDIATSQVMCSKDRVAAWKSVIDGTAPKDAHACDAGTHTVKINSDLFTGVGFNSTPTIIADNGRILVGEASRDELMALLN
jgi:thiol:disulfide interchange protein DsbC